MGVCTLLVDRAGKTRHVFVTSCSLEVGCQLIPPNGRIQLCDIQDCLGRCCGLCCTSICITVTDVLSKVSQIELTMLMGLKHSCSPCQLLLLLVGQQIGTCLLLDRWSEICGLYYMCALKAGV